MRTTTGRLGEQIAARYLAERGHTIVGRNVRVGVGEIDIVSIKGKTVHLVEVKAVTREPSSAHDMLGSKIVTREPFRHVTREMLHTGEDHLDWRKLRKLEQCAKAYMGGKGKKYRGYATQIDGIAIDLINATRTAHCRYYPQILG